MPSPEPQAPPGSNRPWIGAAVVAIVLFSLGAYAGGFHGVFTFDDIPAILQNATLRHLWPPGPVLRPIPGGLTVSGRPLLNLSLALNYAISGTNPWSYHVANLLIHVGVALALLGIVRRTSGSLALGFSVSLIWAVHPLQTEAVMYVVQRAESLMALWYLLTLYCFIRGAEAARRRPWLLLSALTCFAGMATKEVMVSAPVMVLLYDRTFVAGSFAEAWRRRRAYYACLAATWIPLALLVASTGSRGGTSGFSSGVSWTAYWLTQFPALGNYLRLSVWPHPLVFEYGPTWVGSAAEVIPSAVVVGALVAGTVWALVRRPAWGFLGAWFFAILAPTSLVPGTRQMVVEYRMYLALPAVLVALAILARTLANRAGLPRVVRLAAVILLAMFLNGATSRRVAVYNSEVGLWEDTVAKRPRNPFALYDLGDVYWRLGRPADAERCYERVLALNPNYTDVRIDLGNALFRQGRLPEALVQYAEAVRLSPGDAAAHNALGGILAQAGRFSDARAQFAEAVRLDPGLEAARRNLAQIDQVLGAGR